MEKPEWTFWSTQYNHVPMSPQLTASASAPSLSYYPCGNSVSPPGCLFLTSSLLYPQVSFFLRFYPSLLVAPPSTYGTLQNSRHHSWTPQFQHLISIRFTCKIHPGLDHFSHLFCHYYSSSHHCPFLGQLLQGLNQSPCLSLCPPMVSSLQSSQRHLNEM